MPTGNPSMRSALLFELATLFRNEADAIAQPYAWPPRAPLSTDEPREVQRLDVTAASIAYRGNVAAYEQSVRCRCGDGSCVLCDDLGMVPA